MYPFFDDIIGTAETQFVVLGNEALEISDMLRKEARLVDPNYQKHHWDFRKFLDEKRKEHDENIGY